MNFEFWGLPRLMFGGGAIRQAAEVIRPWGRRVLVVCGRDVARAAAWLGPLKPGGAELTFFPVAEEPTVERIREGVAAAADCRCEALIGIGGGSALDAAKAIAALVTNGGDPLDYLEGVGRGEIFRRPALPLLAIPTTAGTGSEATRNAVLRASEFGVKVSLRSPLLIPPAAIVDPELTYGLPPAITACTGMDALTQLLEAFTSRRANPLTDALCRDGIARSARSLRRAVEHGRDAPAREDLALASLESGLALANAGLGAVHGLAGPLGGSFAAAHGAICAALLPPVMAQNLQALRQRQPNSAALDRYREIAGLLTGRPDARPEDGIAWVAALANDLQIPPLRAFGVDPQSFPALVEKSLNASSMRTNPVDLTREELTAALSRAW